MSRTARFASTLLVLAALTCGSLGAWPLGLRMAPAKDGGDDFLTGVVEWIVSILGPERSSGEAPKPPQPTKDGSTLDPHGGH